MGARLNRETYEKMIAENIEWLMTCPPAIERDHILVVLQCSADREYSRPEIAARADARIAVLEKEVNRWRAEVAMLCGYDSAEEMDAATGARGAG